MEPFGRREQLDMQTAIRLFGQEVTLLDSDGPRTFRARVRMLTAAELVNCMELYNMMVICAAQDFPTHPPKKGMIFLINGVRRGVVEVLESKPSNLLVGWHLGVKG